MNNPLITKLGTTINVLLKSIKKIPEDKQPIINMRVKKVMQKHNLTYQKFMNLSQQNINFTDSHLTSMLKDLQFNLNFIKLSYPQLNFNIQQLTKQQEEQIKKNQQKKNLENNTAIQEKDKQKPIKSIQFQLENEQSLKQSFKPMPNVREQVEFSNWSEGNIDPQKLKKHKELLQRQFFQGDHWSNKQKPKNAAQIFLQNFLANPPSQPPKVTEEMLKDNSKNHFQNDPIEKFKKVKR